MAWTLPDDGEGDNTLQSILFQEYLDVLVAGISGVDCVLSGGAVTGGATMTPAVAKCAVLTNRVLKAVAAANVTIGTADATNPRLDLIVVTSAGALAVRAGTAAAAPKPPVRTANDVVLAAVYVPAADTSIETTKCIDMRVFPPLPTVIYRTSADETTNNTAAAIHILDKTNSGVVIPDGLFLAGRCLRGRIWGDCLINSGTPTMTLAVTYGATTMFSDVSAATIASTVRRTFMIEFHIMAQGNADQALSIVKNMNDWSTAIAAPTTGLGDLWPVSGSSEPSQVGTGSAAVNSDAADSTLTVQFTYSAAAAANEIVVNGATLELL